MIRMMGVVLLTGLLAACAGSRSKELTRQHDEIVVAGRFFHTGAPVVLWFDPPNYDAYRVNRRFGPHEQAGWNQTKEDLDSPDRYGERWSVLTESQREQVQQEGWTLDLLQEVVDLVVVHYDVTGTSRRAFEVLHDRRGLSAHFLLDVDGTIYQTLDLKERAWHAGSANSRAIGIEIAHIGAYAPGRADEVLSRWYEPDEDGGVRLTLPEKEQAWLRTEGFVGRPVRPGLVTGVIQGQDLVQYDFTREQYASLARLLATLSRVFPKVELTYPQDEKGHVVPHVLDEAELEAFQGVLGHYHLTTRKIDPGPAFDWEGVIHTARRERRR